MIRATPIVLSWLTLQFLWLTVASNAAVAQRREQEFAYGPDPKQRLDLSLPTITRFPTVIFIHGGSLTSGDKADEHRSGTWRLLWIGCDANADSRMYGSLTPYLDHWPIHHVRAAMPPFLFLIAEGEKEQPPVLKTDSTFVEKARALGNWAEYKILPGRTHLTAIRRLGEPGDQAFSVVRDFVRQFSVADRKESQRALEVVHAS